MPLNCGVAGIARPAAREPPIGKHFPRPKSLHTALVATTVAICLIVLGLEGWHAWEARSKTLAADAVATENLTLSLAQHMHDSVKATDVAIFGIREWVEREGASAAMLERVHRRMVATIGAMPIIHGLFIYDANGDWVVNSVSTLPARQNNADRAYFQYHQMHSEDAVHIDGPVHSKSDGSWIVTVSRRINTPQGNFAGVILASIAVDSLHRYFGTFDVGPLGAITLMSTGGVVFARSPRLAPIIGVDLSGTEFYRHYLQHKTAGAFTTVYLSDGITRIGNYRQLDEYPLLVVVAHGLDDVLLEWRGDTRLHTAIGLGMVLALALLGNRFATQLGRTQRAEQRYRLLADNASDAIVCIGLTGERLYLSPAFATLTGWSIEEGVRLPWDRFVHPDDQQTVLDTQAQLQAGVGQVTCHLRYVCQNQTSRWAEARVVLLGATDGEKPQYVATVRDITERKAAEDEVTMLHRELKFQASTDALTGLANRRRFDQALEEEWRRAARDDRCLSLLMLDVDRFKLYNDRYGHQRGDKCLADVAAVIAARGRRAGDIAARYGGEEFACLLPGADAAAAAMLAEQLRAAIQAMGIEHADNQPSLRVTASVGVTTLYPVPANSAAGSAGLVAAADAALYQAKHEGRNRVVTQPCPAVAGITPIPLLQPTT